MDFSKKAGNGFFYRWEENNRGLDHKCGICATVLSNPRAKKTCFGVHEEVCIGYHKTLFYIGTSHKCEPCSTQREQHYQRHREIAALVQRVQRLDDGVVIWSNSPLPKKKRWSRASSESNVADDEMDLGGCNESDDEWPDSSTTELTEYGDIRDDEDPKSTTRRERKVARKAARDRDRFAALNIGDISRVHTVLHGTDEGVSGEPGPAKSLDLKTIGDNIAFNPNTFKYASLRVDVHKKKVLKNNVSSKSADRERRQSQDLEITTFIQRLGIDSTEINGGPKERRSLLVKLREAIRNDLEGVANEEQQRMMRMAGYWRYANRRTYNHMVQKNQIWDWETGAKLDVIDEGEELDEEGSSSSSNPVPERSARHVEVPNNTLTNISPNTPTQGSPAAGQKDTRHLQYDTPVSTPCLPDKLKPTNVKAQLQKENVRSAETQGNVKVYDDEDDLRSPLKPRIIRITVPDSSKPKSVLDRNNRFAPLARHQETDLKPAPDRYAAFSATPTSRRSSIRRTANPQKPAEPATPSPLRNIAGTSSRAQALNMSAFPALPVSAKAIKPKPKLRPTGPHPPARLTPEQATSFAAEQARQGKTSSPVDYAAILRLKLQGS